MKVLSPSMFVAIFGHLRPHPWIEFETLSEDAYSLFVSRSELMGWSPRPSQADSSGLWGMNDASFDHSSEGHPPRIAWFQVGIDERAFEGASLPFHPLLACARDAIRRVGDLELEAAQFLVPLQDATARAAISSVPNWFNACDPDSHVGMRITLDSGDDAILPRVASELAELASGLARKPFAVALASADAAHVQLLPEVTGGFWLGGSRHPVTFDAIAPDWSPDSIAWTANLLAESCRRVGVRTSILINIGKR